MNTEEIGLEVRKHIDKSFMNGILKLIILRKIKAGEDYPYAILKALSHKNHHMPMKVTKNDVYNNLNALEKEGFVTSEARLISGKVQKKYKLTPKGKEMLKKARAIIVLHIKRAKELIADFNA